MSGQKPRPPRTIGKAFKPNIELSVLPDVIQCHECGYRNSNDEFLKLVFTLE